MAVEATQRNAEDNGVSDQIAVRHASVAQIAEKEWDIVVVNILAIIIQELLAEENLMAYVKADGVMIMSGILVVQSAEMTLAIENAGGHIIDTIQQGDWIALVVKRT